MLFPNIVNHGYYQQNELGLRPIGEELGIDFECPECGLDEERKEDMNISVDIGYIGHEVLPVDSIEPYHVDHESLLIGGERSSDKFRI